MIFARRALCGTLIASVLPGCAVTSSSRLSLPDQADVARIQAYLDALTGLRARFVQTSSDDSTSSGTAWYDPGRLRLQYDGPVHMVVVASGQRLVAHRDSDGATTRISLSVNPLGLLLARPLRLSGNIDVIDIKRGPGILQASLARRSDPAQGLLTLVFSDHQPGGLALIGLEAVDARRHRTRFQLTNATAGLNLNPALFTPPAG